MNKRELVIDTDTLSFLVRPSGRLPAPESVRPLVDAAADSILYCSRLTIGEIIFGAYKRKWGAARLEGHMRRVVSRVQVVELEPGVVETWARVRAARLKRTISAQDAFIAATAIFMGLPLLTNNIADFGGLEAIGLTLHPVASLPA